MNDVEYSSWHVVESPITIEYSLDAIENIGRAVIDGSQRQARGGIEVGGVLYGTRDGSTIRVLTTREIACEHTRGPVFMLSDRDRAALTEQLAQVQTDPIVKGLTPVGWFVSHTSSGISLPQSDLDIYESFFPEPWQVALVVRTGRGTSMRAGFFVREPDGSVKRERSYLDFNLPEPSAAPSGNQVGTQIFDDQPPDSRIDERNSIAQTWNDRTPGNGSPDLRLDQRVPEEHVAPVERRSVFRRASDSQAAELAKWSDTPATETQRVTFPGLPQLPHFAIPRLPRRWPILLAWAVAVAILAIAGARYFKASPAPQPIALSVFEHDGQLQIGWNHNAKPVKNGIRGSIEIVDGDTVRTIDLSPSDLAQGSLTYARKTAEVEVRMTVADNAGEKTEEASRFLGRAPSVVDDGQVVAADQRLVDLEKQIRVLQQQKNQQAERIRQLERTLLILRSRGDAPPTR